MKRHILPIALLCAATATGAILLPGSMNLRGPLRIAAPLLTDTVDTKGKKYDTAALLQRNLPGITKASSTKRGAVLTPGQDSIYRISNDGQEAMYILTSRLRSDVMFNGNIVVESTAPFAVYLNGKKIAVKDTRNDSLTTASRKSEKITLEPYVAGDLQVRLLAAPSAATEVKVTLQPDSLSAGAELVMGHEVRNRYQLADTDQGTRAASTSISPDGKYTLVSYLTRDEKQKVTRRSEIVDTRTLAVIGEAPAGSSWMPAGHTLSFTRADGDTYDIYTLPLPSLTPVKLHSGVPQNSFTWAPDTSYILYYYTQEPDKNSSAFRRYASPDDRIEGNRRRYGLRRYTFATGLEEDITFGTKNVTLADISSDSRRILCLTQRETPSKYPFYLLNLIEVDMASMKADTIVAENAFISGAIYSPKADKLFITGSPRTFGDLGLNAGDHPIPNDFDTQGYIMELASRKVTPMTRDFNPSITGTPVWNAADNRIYFRAQNGFCTEIFALNPSTGAISGLPADMQNVANFSIGRDESRFLTCTGQGDSYAGRASMLNLANSRTTLLADPFAERLGNIELGPTTGWNFITSDGTEIEGTMTLPPDFDPQKKYPLIVYYYGGTSPSQHGLLHPYVPQLYASRGYVVYVLNPSGTYGYGQEFSARHVNAWGKRTANDIIEGVKRFCSEHPFVDSKKIGCMGASYGGFMTQYLQTQTDIFAAAISHAGISDVTSYWGEGYWGYTYNSVAAAESYPWTNPELFTRQGSLFNADKIHTPLLLIHGTADTNVPIGESIQIFNALRVLGREVEFISVDGENHTSGSFPFEKRQIWHDTILAWFSKYLKGDSRWWDKMYPDPKL